MSVWLRRVLPWCAAVLIAAVAFAREAVAGPSRVVVLRDTGQGATLEEASNRLRAELGAAGFDVLIRPLPASADPRAALEQAARDAGAFAAVLLSGVRGGTAADVWVVDRLTGKTLIRTVEVRGSTAPSDVAVRAVDLLHASLLEATGSSDHARSEPRALPRDVKSWVEADRARAFAGVSIEIGAGVLHGAGGIGPAFCSQLRLSLGNRSGLAGRLAFVGPAFGADLSSPLGRAAVRQELAALGLLYALHLPSTPLVPVFSIGAGGYHLYAAGSPKPPYIGVSDEVWAALFELGAGTGLHLGPRTLLLLDVHAILTEPRPVVTLASRELGSAGRPSLLVSIGLVTSFF